MPGSGQGSGPAAVKRQQKEYANNFHYGEDGNEADRYTPAQRLEGNVRTIEALADVLFGSGKATDGQKALMSLFRGWGQVDLSRYWDVDALRSRSPIYSAGAIVVDGEGYSLRFAMAFRGLTAERTLYISPSSQQNVGEVPGAMALMVSVMGTFFTMLPFLAFFVWFVKNSYLCVQFQSFAMQMQLKFSTKATNIFVAKIYFHINIC